MSTALTRTAQNSVATAYGDLTHAEAAEVAANIKAAKAGNTERAYASQWRRFVAWCDRRGKVPLPATAEVVALYLGQIASTNSRNVARAAIRAMHKHEAINPTSHPGVKEASKGAARRAAQAGVRVHKARAMTLDEMRQICAHLDAHPDTTSQRDAALICAGWWAATRRSELVAWRCEDVTFNDDGGADVFIPSSKTDQTAQGATVYLPAEAGARLRQLCAGRRGFVFVGAPVVGNRFRKAGEKHPLDGNDVSLIVKRRADAAGIKKASEFSGHSFRRGFITDRSERGAALTDIAVQTRHRSLDTLRGYNAAGKASVKRVLALD